MNKRQQEEVVVKAIIKIYCDKKHVHINKDTEGFCADCRALADYAKLRIGQCPFMETKTFCSNCKVHCYETDMRERIREVMRFGGPRMLIKRPLLTLRHIYYEKKEKFIYRLKL